MKLIRHPASDGSVRPFIVIWEVTRACDLACRHCRAEAQPDVAPGTLTFEQGTMLLSQLVDFGRPYPLLILTGGDPFKRGDVFDLVDYGTGLGLAVALSPSGTPLLTRENLLRAKAAGAKAISLSLDGSTPERHDDFRRVRGSFALTIAGWEAARQIGLKLQVNTTVTCHNLFDLPGIFKLVLERGAMTWSLFFLVLTGRGREEDEVSAEEYEAVMHLLYDASKYISAKTTEGHHYKRIVLQRSILEEKGLPLEDYLPVGDVYRRLKDELDGLVEERGLRPREVGVRRPPMHINAGAGFAFVNHRGDVFPSGFLPLSAGNVLERPLVEIYRQSPLFRSLRDPSQLGGQCGLCEFSGVCGGSRSRAYALSGDPLAEEPFCTYVPHSFPFQEELQARLQQE